MTRLDKEVLIHELDIFKDSMIRRYNITDASKLDDIDYVVSELVEFGYHINFEMDRYLIFDIEELHEFIEFYEQKKDAKISLKKCIRIVEMLFEENLSEE